MSQPDPHNVSLEALIRPAATVMDIDRLGSMHQSRLSFMRSLVRRVMQQQWSIDYSQFDLDQNGYGTAIFRIQAQHDLYNLVIFSNYLADEDRNDRVIADQWDLTFALCLGEVSQAQVEEMRDNVPKQEEGRMHANMLVLSRANRSSRNFEYVVSCLAQGQQPDAEQLTKVGYLYRTTAVYGSGKFGLADWNKVKKGCPDFSRPFSAEMFTCYLLRQFSIDQVEHLAQTRSPDTFQAMSDEIKRYFGIGNSTGLGMAPYLIKHPLLISRWLRQRETALAEVVATGEINDARIDHLIALVNKVRQHFRETFVPDELQIQRNTVLKSDLKDLGEWLVDKRHIDSWESLLEYIDEHYHIETQELLRSLLLELYPELVNEYEDKLVVSEEYLLDASMPVTQFIELLEAHYDWALSIDFNQPDADAVFWYRSEEKMEPRLGQRTIDPGDDKAIRVTIARDIRHCYDALREYQQGSSTTLVAEFLLVHPEYKGIIKRAQTMANDVYGEIRANLSDKGMLPMNLLRCKLSFFGVSKFDPKSKLWVRNTMFQGAPTVADIGNEFFDDWSFPIAPTSV